MMSLPQRVTLEQAHLWLQQTALICLEKVRFLFSELLVFLLLNIKHQETRCFSVCVQINNKRVPWHIRMGCQHLWITARAAGTKAESNLMTETSLGSQYKLNWVLGSQLFNPEEDLSSLSSIDCTVNFGTLQIARREAVKLKGSLQTNPQLTATV